MTANATRSRLPPGLGGHAPLLHPSLLARVRQLNLHYLQLLRVEYRDAAGNQLNQLPAVCREGLMRLSAAACERLCSAPYPLYSLGFENPQFWPAACAAVCLEQQGTAFASSAAATARRSLFELTVLHAWHVAVTSPVAARVVYAMGEDTIHAFSAVALPRVMLAAAMQCEVLAPRWPGNPLFWPALIRSADRGDDRRLLHIHLLGSQLVAAELELAGLSDDAAASIVRAAMSPRLRERKARLSVQVRALRDEAQGSCLQGARGLRHPLPPRRTQ